MVNSLPDSFDGLNHDGRAGKGWLGVVDATVLHAEESRLALCLDAKEKMVSDEVKVEREYSGRCQKEGLVRREIVWQKSDLASEMT